MSWTVTATWLDWQGPLSEDHPDHHPDDLGRHAPGLVFGLELTADTRHEAEGYRRGLRQRFGALPGFAVDISTPAPGMGDRAAGIAGVRRVREQLHRLTASSTLHA